MFWKPSLETRYVVRIFFNSAKKTFTHQGLRQLLTKSPGWHIGKDNLIKPTFWTVPYVQLSLKIMISLAASGLIYIIWSASLESKILNNTINTYYSPMTADIWQELSFWDAGKSWPANGYTYSCGGKGVAWGWAGGLITCQTDLSQKLNATQSAG